MGEEQVPQSQNSLTYVLEMREKLKSMAELAQQNLEQAQQRQRTPSTSVTSPLLSKLMSIVFAVPPGHTTLVDHHITLCAGAVPRRMSYRTPELLLAALKEEVEESPWASLSHPRAIGAVQSCWCQKRMEP